MRILLFGGTGQLGFEIKKRAYDLNFEVVSPVLSEVDITDSVQVRYLTEEVHPTLVINCAAYTAVDLAEEEPEKAYAINRDGARNVADAASAVGVRVFHLSTDYVFDGTVRRPVTEEDPTNPLNVYGQSKREGERVVLTYPRSTVIRTSSLFGQKGVNFVATMVRLFGEKEVVRVVNDQVMSPTWAGWLAEVLLDLGRTQCEGIVHASCSGTATWYEFAGEILKLVKGKVPGAERVKLEPITAEGFARPARRPAFSVLSCDKLSKLLGRQPLSWQDGLRGYLHDVGLLS